MSATFRCIFWAWFIQCVVEHFSSVPLARPNGQNSGVDKKGTPVGSQQQWLLMAVFHLPTMGHGAGVHTQRVWESGALRECTQDTRKWLARTHPAFKDTRFNWECVLLLEELEVIQYVDQFDTQAVHGLRQLRVRWQVGQWP